jgi:tripartite motif-containing protein 71
MINYLKAVISALLILLVFPQAPAAASGYLNLKAAFPLTGYYPILGPGGVAVDSSLNIFVADVTSNRILKINNNTGALLASWGGAGSSIGQFNQPQGVAVDSTGNVYVADSGNNRIQKFTYNTSSGAYAYAAQWDGAASGNALNYPSGVTVDSSGNVYVADTNNHRIQKFDSSGNHLMNWGSPGSLDGQFIQPKGVAVDNSGNIFVADTGNNRVQKFTSSTSTWSSLGTQGTGNGQFASPQGVAVDSAGNIFVADTGNNRWQAYDSSFHVWNSWGSGGSGIGQFSSPQGIAVYRGASNTVVFVADTNNARMQKYNYWILSSPTVTYLGQLGSRGSGNGQFNQPQGVAVDSAGNIYVADSGNNRIQKFNYDPASDTYTYAAQWGVSGSGAGQFSSPAGVAVDSAGNLFVADTGNNRIQRYDHSSLTWSSFGDLTQSGPHGVAVDGAGNVFVADSYNNRIQKFNSAGTHLAQWGYGGQGSGAFYFPTSVAVDSAGNVYVTDFDNQRIEKFYLTTSGGYTFLTQWGFVGSPGIGGSGDGQFNGPTGVAVDGGNLYVTDTYNYRIQKFTLSGNFRGTWNSFNPGAGQFYGLSGVVAAGGNLYVVDRSASRVLIFSAPAASLPMLYLLLD